MEGVMICNSMGTFVIVALVCFAAASERAAQVAGDKPTR
jgi:hypothetical protein